VAIRSQDLHCAHLGKTCAYNRAQFFGPRCILDNHVVVICIWMQGCQAVDGRQCCSIDADGDLSDLWMMPKQHKELIKWHDTAPWTHKIPGIHIIEMPRTELSACFQQAGDYSIVEKQKLLSAVYVKIIKCHQSMQCPENPTDSSLLTGSGSLR
jgi:hypothetical protein